jgi:putative transposase
VARSTVYRSRRPGVYGPLPAPVLGIQPTALDPTERDRILQVLNSPAFADKSPAQVWAIQLDHGVYLGSVSTIYRVLRQSAQVRERRSQASHPARVRPELLAAGPNDVWCWDITKLKGPTRGCYFDAFVIMDIFSRRVVHWEAHATENGELAKDFLDTAVVMNGGVAPGIIHSDNGTSMTSKNVAALLADLHIDRSLSRPHVSNDNPHIEASFKTLKYCPAFPGNFASIYDARIFLRRFFTYYNNEHRHSGIGLYTPQSVHDGTWRLVQQRRQLALDAAYAERPDRFHLGRPIAPGLPAQAWINRPPSTIQTTGN